MLEMHKDIRTLIQHNADEALDADERALMLEHVKGCPSCKMYADELRDLESTIRQSMMNRWNARHLPVSIEPIRQAGKRGAVRPAYHVAFRLAAVSALVVSLALFIFQSVQKTSNAPAYQALAIIPTPSLIATNSMSATVVCPDILYVVKAGDTLASVAKRFGVSEERIREANALRGDGLPTGSRLNIPICNSTPTSATLPFTSTFTLTPYFDGAAITPDS